jgi:hypothetical protein
MKSKYLGNLSFEDWFQTPQNTSKNNSITWKALVDAFPFGGQLDSLENWKW